jgi:hypothetical protein
LGKSRDDPLIPYLAIGLTGGLAAWCVHHMFEYYYTFLKSSSWAYLGLIQAMVAVHWAQVRQKKEGSA